MGNPGSQSGPAPRTVSGPALSRLSPPIGRGLVWLAAGLLAATLAVHVRNAVSRIIDPDELEHLNAAYFVARGETMYGSFFENHPPLTVAVLQPVVRSSDDPRTILRRGRFLSLLAMAVTLVAVAWLGHLLASWPGAAVAAWLLASHTFFARKAIEVRPDVYATLFLVLGLCALIRGLADGRAARFVASGALLATGGLFTPKIVYAAAGAALGALLAAPGAGRRRRARVVLGLGAGAGLVTVLAVAEMARRGMLAGFVRDCVVVSARMTIDESWGVRRYLLERALLLNPVFCLLGLAGLALFLRPRCLCQHAPSAVLGCSALAGLAGLFHVGAPLTQYHLTFLPQLAVAGAVAFVALLARAGAGARAWALLLLGFLAQAVAPGMRLLAAPVTHAAQLEMIAKVRALTGERSRVLDCWTGLYLTRLPAYRYFFINSDVLRLLDPAALERDLHACLDDPAVEVVIKYAYFSSLPASVQARVECEFARVKGFPFLLHRPAPDPAGDER